MRIVILSGPQKATEDLSYDDIKGTPSLYAYYLRKEFEKMGVETIPCRCPSITESDVSYQKGYFVPEGDHILSLEQRGWLLREHCPTLLAKVKKSISGKMLTICDNNDVIGKEDTLFYAVPASAKEKSVYVGWAADPFLCYPDKRKGILRILIDHSYYGKSDTDLSVEIVRDVLQFAQSCDEEVIVRRFISGGAETIALNETPKKDVYSRGGLSYLKACEEYRKADIFIVTHPESLGLSVIESARAGALIVIPRGYIKPSLIKSLNVYEFTEKISWGQVLSQLNPELSEQNAAEFTWDKIAKKIIGSLE